MATKQIVSDFYFKYPTATVDQLLNKLTDDFEDFSILKATVYRYLGDLWFFTLKKVMLEPVEKNTPSRLEERKK